MSDTTDIYLQIPPTPRELLPPEMGRVLDQLIGPAQPSQSRTAALYTIRDGDNETNKGRNKKLPQLPIPQTHDHTHSPSNAHAHSRSVSLSNAHVQDSVSALRNRSTWAVGFEDTKSDERWSITPAVDGQLVDSDSEQQMDEKDENDSEGSTQSTTYVSSLRDDPPPYSSPARSRTRSRIRSCDFGDGVGQASPDQYRTHKNDRSHEIFMPQACRAASPAMVAASGTPSLEKETLCRRRDPRRAARFTPENPTKRHAMYISSFVWQDGVMGSGSEVSESPEVKNSK